MAIEDVLDRMSRRYQQIELSYDATKPGWKLKASGGKQPFEQIDEEEGRAKDAMDAAQNKFDAYEQQEQRQPGSR